MDYRATFALSKQALTRLDQIQIHYRKTLGLDLSGSAVARRAIDALFKELGLVEDPTQGSTNAAH